MNKKFLSAILLGAFLASSTGTFVSCKDYDDEIDDLQEQINGKATTLDELKSQVTVLQSDLTGAKQASAEALTAAKDAVAAADKAVADAKDAAAAATAAAEKATADAQLAAAQAKAEAIAAAEAKVAEMQKTLQAAVDDKLANVDKLVNDVKALAAEVSGIVGKRLASLVFQPVFYYQGIEAMEAIGITYNALTVSGVNADDEFGTDAPVAGAETTLVPDLVANYHVNPTSAEVPSSVSAYSFLRFDKSYVRSATSAPTIVKTNVANGTVANGMLTVNAHFTDADIKDINANGQVTVLALQVHTGDTVVTSDYAAVKANNYKELKLAAVDSIHPIATADRHLFTTAAAAIADNNHVCPIMWNSNGIDIARLVNTHRTNVDAAATHTKWDERAADGTVKQYGFKYSYELVGYHKGNNSTSESAHAALKGSVIRPQITSNGKQQAWGFTQNRATKDREPLVRVILTDTISGKIASVGYLKFKITDTASTDQVLLSPIFPFTSGYTVNCSENAIKLSLTWHQVEEQILAQLESKGISKDQFHSEFTLDGGTVNATQYNGVTVASTAITGIGVVAQTTWDPSDNMTEVLTWTIKNNEAYNAFKSGATSITANVRYTRTTSINEYVYVTFTWTPAPLNIAPNGTIADANKIAEYWYPKNKLTAKPNPGEYSDIHANVRQVISNNSSDCTFASDILNTFTNNVITVTSDVANYPAFTNAALTKDVVFSNPQDFPTATGATGKVYTITVDPTGKTLQATNSGVTKDVVKLVAPTSGAAATVMQYQTNDFALDLLNKEDHDKLEDGETFTAKLQVNASLCDYVAYKLTGNVFYAKYLRPVSADPSNVDDLKDASNGSSIATLSLNLVDWRDKHFDVTAETTGDDGTNYNFYGFYGVTQVVANFADATTNANGGTLGETKLSSISQKVDLRFGADIAGSTAFSSLSVGNNGKFYYRNNGTTLGQCTIRVPLTVSYKWGTIYTSVDLNINKTINN